MEGSISPERASNVKLDRDQEMFIYRWYPIMGSIYCSKQLGVHPDTVRRFANDMGLHLPVKNELMSIEKIAKELNMSVFEVQQCLNSAMCKLREEFERRQLNE